MSRKTNPAPVEPTFPPDRAHRALKTQLEALQTFKGKSFEAYHQTEKEWTMMTQHIVEKSFGKPSTQLTHFFNAKSTGEYFIAPFGYGGDARANALDQSNFVARTEAFESFLRAALSALELEMPEQEIKGQYDPNEEYEFYRDIKQILSLVTSDVMIVDAYLDTQFFDTYADGIKRSVKLRLLTKNVPAAVLTIAGKYATGGNLELRTSNLIHDRLILIDNRVWFIGQSIKDAAKKKPTYIVEQDGTNTRPTYESIWNNATKVI